VTPELSAPNSEMRDVGSTRSGDVEKPRDLRGLMELEKGFELFTALRDPQAIRGLPRATIRNRSGSSASCPFLSPPLASFRDRFGTTRGRPIASSAWLGRHAYGRRSRNDRAASR
jgi:hypothetical protein